MTMRGLAGAVAASICVALGLASISTTAAQKAPMTDHASGTFDVTLAPQAPSDQSDAAVGRMIIDKRFAGDLTGTSKGEMLAVSSGSVKESAGYVAMEKVTGALQGRTGTFALQHSGTMNRGAPSLAITVVPDSGTGELVGLSGTMTITITGGKHLYGFDYTLAR